jgi:hypothetical protein
MMEQGQGDCIDCISEVKAEPLADEFELETNRSTPSEDDVDPMETDDLDKLEIPVVSIKAETEQETPKNGDSSKDKAAVKTSNPHPQMEDPFASLKNLPSTEGGDQVIDLSKKVGVSTEQFYYFFFN